MSQRHHISLVAAGATVLAVLPLGSIFVTWTWLYLALITIAAIMGTGMAVRAARGPVWAQGAGMATALLLCLTWLFPSGNELGRLVPTPATFENFAHLLNDAGSQIQQEAIPVPNLDGIFLLTTAGIGLVALLVDLFAVGLRRPALAGLPMLAIYSVPVAVLPEGMSLLPFALAAIGFMWLLVTDSVDRVRRFGRRFTGDGRDVDLWEPSPLASAGRRLGVIGVVVAVMLPLAVPWTSGILDRFLTGTGPGAGLGTGNGLPAQVDLFALLTSSLNRDKAFEMVRVSTNEPFPYYLRIGVADQVAPDGFRNRPPSGGDPLRDPLPTPPAPQINGVRSESFQATVDVIDFDSQLAPVYQQATAVRGLDKSWSYDPVTNQIWSRRSSVTSKKYVFDYVHTTYTEAALRQAGPYEETDANLTYVPPNRQVEDTVAELTAGKTTEYDQVRGIYNFFSPSNNFRYTLKPKAGTSGNAMIDFLAAREGFCVQYAVAMAWLVRAAGYPARVAIGFTRGSAIDSHTYALTNFNLHAWTEVYFPDIGWVPFDATPPANVLGSAPSVWAPDLSVPASAGPSVGPERPTPGAGASGGAGNKGDREVDTGGIAGALRSTTGKWALGGVAVGLLAAFLLLLPAVRRSALRRRRRPRSAGTIVVDGDALAPPGYGAYALVVDADGIPAARRDAHAAWAEMLDTMIDFNVPVDAAETPRTTAHRLGGLSAVARSMSADADLLASAEERARYARTPLRADPLEAAGRGVRQALHDRASRRERLAATLMPRSVLLRWRSAWIGIVSTMVTTVGVRRDQLVRALSPRRLLAGRAK
jgi:transglutaminase-like putative cysteine protease